MSLQYRDTGVRVRMVVIEQLTLNMTNTRNHLDVYSLVSSYLDAAAVSSAIHSEATEFDYMFPWSLAIQIFACILTTIGSDLLLEVGCT